MELFLGPFLNLLLGEDRLDMRQSCYLIKWLLTAALNVVEISEAFLLRVITLLPITTIHRCLSNLLLTLLPRQLLQ